MNLDFRKFIYTILTILTITFIFYNSFKNGAESSNISNNFTAILNNFLLFFKSNVNLNSSIIRKVAHFIEFFFLGVFISFTFDSFSKNLIKYLGYILFIVLFIAVLDETIQIFSIGRTSSVLDSLLDFSGSFTGIIYSIIFLRIKNFFKYKNKYKYKYKYKYKKFF